ncbi:MAG: hypothetical protein AAB505_01015 [Patescibacteria group bacterium]
MRLPHDLEALREKGLTRTQLEEAIKERRRTIRSHRDETWDDRCHLDDFLLYEHLDDSPSTPSKLPTEEEMMRRCKEFYEYRRAETADRPDPDVATIIDKRRWNEDLLPMDREGLLEKLYRIQQTIKKHRDIDGRSRTVDDDRELYRVLPENVMADFRLPPRDKFLGKDEGSCSGCRPFWKSHQDCSVKRCNFTAFGRCTQETRRR